ncbi:MAG: ABC transporter ATP-binding protein [Acidimicrobiia bacterium]|nr:ABC transporter ATP-binding protein [Acidimicrobiia bacterium]
MATGIVTEAEAVQNDRGRRRLLEVEDLRVRFDGGVDAVRGVTFTLDLGETLAIVGESGSGKSTLALCFLGLVQPPTAAGSVRLDGHELLGADPKLLRSLRWSTAALALQGSPFNPVVKIGPQIAESIRERHGASRAHGRRRAADLAEEVALDPALIDRFPHELSGGERRRAALAMALALDPQLLILDEPTAGLDPATRTDVLDRIEGLAADRGFALIVISHDLPGASQLADRAMVLYAGEAVEAGASWRLVAEPAHPYSWALVNAVPVMSTTKDLRPIRGLGPDPRDVPPGCAFHPRCSQAEKECREVRPRLAESRDRLVACHFGGLKELLRAEGLSKTFRGAGGAVRALTEVSFVLRESETVGVIGPSGSGKSTLARIVAGHLPPDAGRVLLGGTELPASWRGGTAKALRRRIQLVMQDPNDALSPRLTVQELVREPLDLSSEVEPSQRLRAVGEVLESVGLPSSGSFLAARTHELSGGQLQRIALARALVLRPKVLIADEPTAMLDASEQARLLVVLRERQVEMGLGLVLVSHDMAVVRKVVDRIVVLDRGEVVEEGRSEQVSVVPTSATAGALVAAAPTIVALSGPGRRGTPVHIDERSI